jgi:large conductance mechanosensitive channel
MARTYQRDEVTGLSRGDALGETQPDQVSPSGGSSVNNLLSEFKKFIMQGDLVAIAVAFIIGLAFKTVVDSLVDDIVMPFVGAIFGKPSFADLTFKIGDGVIHYGLFVNAIVNFLIIAATLFVVMRVYQSVKDRRSAAEKEADPTELDVLTEIRDLLAQGRA